MLRTPVLFCLFFTLALSAQTDVVDAIDFVRKGTYEVAYTPHVAFPSIIRLPNDSLFVVYRKGTSHVDASGQIMRVKGSPDGKFWSAPQILVNEPGVDERDPSLTLLADGRIMLTYYEYKPGNSLSYPPLPAIYSIHASFSNDWGITFSSPNSIDGNNALSIPVGSTFAGDHYILPDASIFQTYATSAPALEYHGRIIIPAYGGNAVIPDTVPGLFVSAPSSIFFFESLDGGVSWNKYSIGENHLANIWKAEPSLVKLDDGKVLMHYRCADNPATPSSPGPMRQAFLDLESQTYQPDQDFGFVGQAPDLIRLSCGVLVSGFRHVNPTPYSADVCMVYSINQGVSWSDTIRIFQGSADCAYPSFIEISPNKLLVSYYTSAGWKINATIYDLNIFLSSSQGFQEFDFTGINENEDLEMSIYPNPCDVIINITLNSHSGGVFEWRLFDNSGNVTRSGVADLSSGQKQFPVSVEDIPSGNYFIELTNNSTRLIEKLVIVR